MGNDIRKTTFVLGVPIDVVSWQSALDRIITWAIHRESRYVTICNAHVVVTAARDGKYLDVISDCDLATPDGAPVAWMLRRLGNHGQPKISGPDLMWALLDRCANDGVSVFLLGSTPETLEKLSAIIQQSFPSLVVAGVCSPPFRAVTEKEDAEIVRSINESGGGIVFVGLGCPKQEQWMAEHRGRISAVMLGVGAAFDFHAGTIKRAPQWMQRSGLEWLHRLCSEPRRLWKRYLITNSLFLLGAVWQLFGSYSDHAPKFK